MHRLVKRDVQTCEESLDETPLHKHSLFTSLLTKISFLIIEAIDQHRSSFGHIPLSDLQQDAMLLAAAKFATNCNRNAKPAKVCSRLLT